MGLEGETVCHREGSCDAAVCTGTVAAICGVTRDGGEDKFDWTESAAIIRGLEECCVPSAQ